MEPALQAVGLLQGSAMKIYTGLLIATATTTFALDVFGSSTTWDRSTTHPKIDPTGVRTYDLQIMTVHFMHVTETPALTTRPSVTLGFELMISRS